jgi:RNA polymerase sigma-70 factor (ECF subfamily)
LNIDEIIKGCLAGNIKHQELLYTMLRAKMLGICLRYSNNKEEAQDILHDGFLILFNSLKNYRNEGPFEAWASKIFVYQSIRTNKKWTLKINDVELTDNDYDYNIFEDTAINSLSVKEILKEIQELPPGYRMIFNLYEIEGYSHKEIGELLEISESTSK